MNAWILVLLPILIAVSPRRRFARIRSFFRSLPDPAHAGAR